MKKLMRKIDEYKVKLEALYIQARRGENCMEEVLALSKEVDRLLIEESDGRNGISRRGKADARAVSHVRSTAS